LYYNDTTNRIIFGNILPHFDTLIYHGLIFTNNQNIVIGNI